MEPSTCSNPSSMAFLEGLPRETPQYRFTRVPNLQRQLAVHQQDLHDKKTTNQFVVFLDIPDHAVCRITDDSSIISHCRIFYEITTRVLILRMSIQPHERAIVVFSDLFHAKVFSMGLSRVLISVGRAEHTYNGYKKQPDNQWGLKPTRQQSFAPSFILEVGYSKSLSRLATDAKWWLESQSSPVKLVITIKVYEATPKVIVQKWELDTQQTHPCPNTQVHPPHTIKTGEVSISRQNNNTVVNGTITLPFDKIFCRPINPLQPQEQDVAFTSRDLEELAEEIWEIQGFMYLD